MLRADMTLQQLRDFIAVVAHGGYRPAARELGLSQAGLTKSIAKLEGEHGVTLLDRSGKGAALTADGVVFLRYAKAIVQEADRAQAWLAGSDNERARRIALGVSLEPSLRLVPAVLADFRRVLPTVVLHLTHGVSSTLVAGVRESRLEFAITRLSPEFDASDLDVQLLFESESVIAARAAHPLRAGATLAELAACEWVVAGDPAQPAGSDPSIRELFIDQAVEPPRIAAVTDSLFGVLAMLVETDALARLPRAVLDHPLVAGRLTAIPTDVVSRRYPIAVVRKAGRQLSREAQTLSAMLASYSRMAPMLATR